MPINRKVEIFSQKLNMVMYIQSSGAYFATATAWHKRPHMNKISSINILKHGVVYFEHKGLIFGAELWPPMEYILAHLRFKIIFILIKIVYGF